MLKDQDNPIDVLMNLESSITCFKKEYNWLSNFGSSPFKQCGLIFPTVEHFFQAHKASSIQDFMYVVISDNPVEAKRRGNNIRLNEAWEHGLKEKAMAYGLICKFSIPKMYELLMFTQFDKHGKKRHLIEGNWWRDTYWGYDINLKQGKNVLGEMLMELRDTGKIVLFNNETITLASDPDSLIHNYNPFENISDITTEEIGEYMSYDFNKNKGHFYQSIER